MKTLCVAVVVLSLISVCQPASLACEKLLKPADTSPEFSGTWYVIAASSGSCFATALLDAMFLISVKVVIDSKETPNLYDAHFRVKINGLCTNVSLPLFFVNNTIFDVDRNNIPTGKPDVLLYSGCPDCFVVRGYDGIDSMMLTSRRQNVTAAELKEFETQTRCRGWTKTIVLNSDHNYVDCPSLDDAGDNDTSGFSDIFYERISANYQEPLKCLLQESLGNPWQWIESLW